VGGNERGASRTGRGGRSGRHEHLPELIVAIHHAAPPLLRGEGRCVTRDALRERWGCSGGANAVGETWRRSTCGLARRR
jgi:hypothetical protein